MTASTRLPGWPSSPRWRGSRSRRRKACVRRHLGVVFDIGHQSVGFEDVRASLAALVSAGIPVFKLQEAAALRVGELTESLVPELKRFTDTIAIRN